MQAFRGQSPASQRDRDAVPGEGIDERSSVANENHIAANRPWLPVDQWRGAYWPHYRLPSSGTLGQLWMQREYLLQGSSAVRSDHRTRTHNMGCYRLHAAITALEKIQIGGGPG